MTVKWVSLGHYCSLGTAVKPRYDGFGGGYDEWGCGMTVKWVSQGLLGALLISPGYRGQAAVWRVLVGGVGRVGPRYDRF